MTHTDELKILIDRAASIVGSDYKIAKQLGIPQGHVSDWRHGRRTCTPADQALLAHMAGLDPVQTLARATVYQYEGKKKGDALMKALGKASRLTGAAAGFVGAVALLISGLLGSRDAMAAPNLKETQCIFSCIKIARMSIDHDLILLALLKSLTFQWREDDHLDSSRHQRRRR